MDFHFGEGSKKHYLDCFEANKTSIMKKYKWPEPADTKFVPEQYVYNLIGLNYKLYCVNTVVKVVEYLPTGITKDKKHFEKNVIGYLYDCTSTLDNILPKIKVSIRTKIIVWWKYWRAKKICNWRKDTPSVQHITPLGILIFLLLPLINFIKR